MVDTVWEPGGPNTMAHQMQGTCPIQLGVAPVCFLFYLLLPLPNRANFQMILASDQLRVHTHSSAPYETFQSKEGHVELLAEIPS